MVAKSSLLEEVAIEGPMLETEPLTKPTSWAEVNLPVLIRGFIARTMWYS